MYLLGLSILYGDIRQVAFTVGGTLSKVNKLKSQYIQGDIISNDISKDNILKEVWKPGLFFGFSYSLAKLK